MGRSGAGWTVARVRAGALVLGAVALVSIGCAAETAAPAPDPSRPSVEVSSAVDRAVATTGDLLTYTVTVSYDPKYEIAVPEPGAEIAGFRIIDLGQEPVREEGGRRIEERWYHLRADLVGSYILPPVKVAYRQRSPEESPKEGENLASGEGTEPTAADPWETAETSEIFIEVESVLPADGELGDIRDIKPLRHLDEPWPLWAWVAAVVGPVALLALAFAVWRWRRRPRPQAPPAPPHEVAFEALRALRRTDFASLEEVRRFYFAISEVLRTYVERRFGLNATDLTREEILARLPELAELGPTERAVFEGFLRDTDRVKFAAHPPSPAEIEETYERALSFVESTRRRPEAEGSAKGSSEAAGEKAA